MSEWNRLYIVGKDGTIKASSNDPDSSYGRLDTADDDLEIVVTADNQNHNDKPQRAELTQFYHKYGFFRLECSDDMPEELMARAVAAAYRVIEEEANKRLA